MAGWRRAIVRTIFKRYSLSFIFARSPPPTARAILPHAPAKPSLITTLARHYDELVDSVRRRFGDRQAAREVVHDVCVQLLESPEKEAVRVPLALLHKITHDRAISHYRSERRRQAWVDDQAELTEVLCNAPSPERQHDAAEELERLCAAITELPPRCQQVFVMHKIHELPQQEVAERLGISVKAVEKHLKVGMAKCLARLGYQEACA